MAMKKSEALKFIKERKEHLEKIKMVRAHGRVTPAEQKAYKTMYEYIDPKGRTICWTCGRSAQIMATIMLDWYEENRKGRKRTPKGEA
jgi:hypothetical protein